MLLLDRIIKGGMFKYKLVIIQISKIALLHCVCHTIYLLRAPDSTSCDDLLQCLEDIQSAA
jgi:hypothetical protein